MTAIVLERCSSHCVTICHEARRKIDPYTGFDRELRVGFCIGQKGRETRRGKPRTRIFNDPAINGRVIADQQRVSNDFLQSPTPDLFDAVAAGGCQEQI